MNAQQFRDLLRDYLTEPPYADHVELIDRDEGKSCMGVTLNDGSRFYVAVQKMAGGPFPGTEDDED